jgi:hypothetical protein
MLRTRRAPAAWPNAAGMPNCLAQRRLPSMMMATCWGGFEWSAVIGFVSLGLWVRKPSFGCFDFSIGKIVKNIQFTAKCLFNLFIVH